MVEDYRALQGVSAVLSGFLTAAFVLLQGDSKHPYASKNSVRQSLAAFETHLQQ